MNGDIAAELYADRMVYGADLDPARVAVCASRLDRAKIVVADCDSWPFSGCEEEFAVADFDAYAYPYDSFRAFWSAGKKAKRIVLLFTDGQRQAIARAGVFRTPDGENHRIKAVNEKRPYYNFWLNRYCKPWLHDAVAPMKVQAVRGCLRKDMLYWGAIVAS